MYTRKRNEYCIQTTVLSTPSTRVRLDVQYLDKNYISVYLNTEILSPYVLGTAEAYLNYRWVDEQTIEFSEELTGVVQFVRTTSLEDNLVKFKESPITADYVDTNNTQLLHIIQEILGGTSDAREYNFEVDGTLMYFDESVERKQMTDAVIQEVKDTASTIFGTPIKVVTPDPLSWSAASRINSGGTLDWKMVDTTLTPDGVVFPKVYYIQTSEEFMEKRTILGNLNRTSTKSITDDMSTQKIELKGKYSTGFAANPAGTQYWLYYLNLPAPSTHFRVYAGNVEYIDATTGEWVVLGTTEDIPALYNQSSEFIAYATDKTTYSSRSVMGNISMDSWSATDAQYVYAFAPSETDKINRALDVGAEFYLESRLKSAELYMRYYPNETECKFVVGSSGSYGFRGYKFCDTRHLPLYQDEYGIDASYDVNKGSDGNVLNDIAYTAARAQRTEYYDTKNPRTDVITANLRLVPLYKFNTDIRAYYKFVGDPVATASFHGGTYKWWWLEAGQYLDIMLQSVTKLNTDWSGELDSVVQGIGTYLAPPSGTPANGYLDNPMEFHNSYVGRGFRAGVPVSTDAGEETLHVTFPHGADYEAHSASTYNPILNAVSDTVFPERYYVAAHKSGTVTYHGVDRDDGTIGVDMGYRIPINSIVPDTPSSVENVQKPWYVNAFIRYKLGTLEETNSDKRALLGNPNTVSESVYDPNQIMSERPVTFPKPAINYPSITKEDSSKTILYTHWGSYDPAYLPNMYPRVTQSSIKLFLRYYGGRSPDVWNIDLIRYNVYDVLPDIDTGKTELLVDATDEETYAGDTVFKQFFMDYVKKIGFYNGS